MKRSNYASKERGRERERERERKRRDRVKGHIKNLNAEIRKHFHSKKRLNVRKNLIPGNTKSLWKAVHTAKDIGPAPIPCSMTFGDFIVREHERSDYFASFFEEKVKIITEQVKVEQDVYNGRQKINAISQMFMGPKEVIECIKSIMVTAGLFFIFTQVKM